MQSIISIDPSLFPLTISTQLPTNVNGADIAFTCCVVENSNIYYCKHDKDGRLIRATEWLCTKLSAHLGIPTAEYAIIENGERTSSYFGSRGFISAATEFDVQEFLTRPQSGQTSDWLGRHLARLYVLDLFLGNPDRSLRNFMLAAYSDQSRQLCAIDFAAAKISSLASETFDARDVPTRVVGRRLHALHGFPEGSAIEMIDQLGALSIGVIEGFLNGMPRDWMTREQRKGICEQWSDGGVARRLHALREGVGDGSLL